MVDPSWQLTARVFAAASQFYVHFDGGHDLGLGGETSLAFFFEEGAFLLTAAMHVGSPSVTVVIYDRRPDPLDPNEWHDVVEHSVVATDHVTLSGWESTDDDPVIPLRPGESYRLRYAIDDMSLARDGYGEDAGRERYLLEFWPETATPAVVVTQESQQGLYWRIASALQKIRDEIRHGRATSTPEDRISKFADRAFEEIPELLADPERWQPSLTATALSLWDWGPRSFEVRPFDQSRIAEAETRVAVLVAEAADRARGG